jgi:acyl-CoA synthetase (AMP-forming)/AMP-acid ligase II
MNAAATVYELLEAGEDHAPAIGAPGRTALSYARLRNQVRTSVACLNDHCVGGGDRVAIVLNNGPEMATAFLSVAAGACAAPLNPAYRADEFEFYLKDLGVKLLIVADGSTSPAIAVAETLNVAVARLQPDRTECAGLFRLHFDDCQGRAAQPGLSSATDVALILHTSGTTSRPKIVPLTQRNICASASNIRMATALTQHDRGLNIMPLFHIHGLMASILAPLSAGGEVSCTEGFNGLRFFQWLAEVRPSWYTAVPTMHQAILDRAQRNEAIVADTQLRFIRSSSSSLPPQVLRALQSVFRAPVIEAYGMTEAAHQITANPLPPRPRKAGSVGIAAGCEIIIMDSAGAVMPPKTAGEIAIRGDNLMSGYEANPSANRAAFTNGWFRTGDEGVFDEDGYLTITGRLKEIINRGGEKISPREVDEVLLDHPAVAQCVTFAMAHERLGEEVAAAVVLHEEKQVSESELCAFVARRLAAFKVPHKIVFVSEIPKGATGKLQRIGLAQKLGLR